MALSTATELADLYEFSTSTGIIIPRIGEVKDRIESMFRDVFGNDLDMTEETPLGRLVEALTVMFRTTLGVNAQNANQFNINTATGIYLDSLAQIYGMSRDLAKSTRAVVTVTTSGIGVTVPAGSLIANSVTRTVFRIVDDIVVPPNEIYGTGIAEAVVAGPEAAERGDITIINTGTLGWLSVTNDDAFVVGRFIETDEQFRARLIDSRPVGMSFLKSMYARIARVKDVSSCVVYENNGSSTRLENGVDVPGHSLFICVLGGLDSDVAKAIADTKTPGTGLMSHAISGSGVEPIEPVRVQYSSAGVSLEVFFYRPEFTDVHVKVSVDASNYPGQSVESDVRNAIVKFVNGVGIGARITSADILRTIASNLDSVIPISAELSLDSEASDSYVTSIQLTGYQKGRSEPEIITVSQI